MKNEELRKIMLYNRTFLGNLYLQNEMVNKKTLMSAKISQLRLLIHLTNKICSGQIPISKEARDALGGKKKFGFLDKNFGTVKKASLLLKKPKFEQQQVLMKLAGSFDSLFFYLFNECPENWSTADDEAELDPVTLKTIENE